MVANSLEIARNHKILQRKIVFISKYNPSFENIKSKAFWNPRGV